MKLVNKEEIQVSPKQKKRSRNTFLVFSCLTVVFATLAIVFAASLPVFTSISDIDGNNIEGISYTEIDEYYFTYSKEKIEKRDMDSNNVIETISYKNEIEEFTTNNNIELLNGSLSEFSVDTRISNDQVYIIVFDNMLNMFKYQNTEDGFVLTNDYYVRTNSGTSKLIDNEGDDYYILGLFSGMVKLEHFNLTNLSSGPIASKYIWEYRNSGDNLELSHIQTTLKYWYLSVTENYIYITESNAIIRINRDFTDYQDFSYFEKAESQYLEIYIAYLKDQIINNAKDEEIRDRYYDVTKIDSYTKSELEKNYNTVTGNKLSDAKKTANAQLVSENSDWLVSYNAEESKIVVKKTSYDKTKYSIINTSVYTNAGKIVYFEDNSCFYIASVYDDSLYKVDISDIENVGILDGIDLDAVATKLDVDFEGKKFSEYNCISVNDLAGIMYVSFLSDNTIVIIDLNENSYNITHSFKANYDVLSLTGNKDNTALHYVVYDKKVDLKGETKTFKSVYSVNPEKTIHQTFVRLAMILSIVFGAICLIVGIVSLCCWLSPVAFTKVTTLGRDLVKNKWVYIALIPFVVLLIFCCYYEAVGSISLSFFDYTRDNPSMKWNNFANYIKIFNEDDFWLSVGNMLFFLVGDLFLQIVPPLIYAFFLSTMRNKKYSKLIRSLLLIPGIIPGIAGLLIWRTGIFGQYGVLNTIIKFFNGEYIEFLANSDISRWSLLLMGFPFVGGYLIIYGGLMNIPKDFYEEAELSGCGVWKRFFKIDIPLVMPQLKYIFIMNFISSVQNYGRTYMLKSMGTITPAEKMYVAMNSISADYGSAAAYATLIFLFLFAAVAANFKLQKKNYLGEN